MADTLPEQVGTFSARVISLLELDAADGSPILLGRSNIAHMISSHPEDYAKYGQFIPLILSAPDYVGKHASNGSIEFVKEFKLDIEYVKVAVRVSAGGVYFARSLYVLNRQRALSFISKGTLKPV